MSHFILSMHSRHSEAVFMGVVFSGPGMLVAFIAFSKAYDKVDRKKLWSCLERMGINGKFLHSWRPV